MNKDIQKCDPCLPGWKWEQETGTLIPLRQMAVIENGRPKRLSAAAAKNKYGVVGH